MAAEMRRAGGDDAVAIADTHVASWQAAYVGQLPQEMLDGLDPADRVDGWVRALNQPAPTAVYVADTTSGSALAASKGSVAAFALVGPARDDDLDLETVGEVMAIYAHPASWGTGVGRALMTRSVQHLVDAGFDEAILWVLASNDRAIRFYQQGGWALDSGEHGSKEDTIMGNVVHELRYRLSLTDRAGS